MREKPKQSWNGKEQLEKNKQKETNERKKNLELDLEQKTC